MFSINAAGIFAQLLIAIFVVYTDRTYRGATICMLLVLLSGRPNLALAKFAPGSLERGYPFRSGPNPHRFSPFGRTFNQPSPSKRLSDVFRAPRNISRPIKPIESKILWLRPQEVNATTTSPPPPMPPKTLIDVVMGPRNVSEPINKPIDPLDPWVWSWKLDNQLVETIYSQATSLQNNFGRVKRFVISGMIGMISLASWLFWAVPAGGLLAGGIAAGITAISESVAGGAVATAEAVEVAEVVLTAEETVHGGVIYFQVASVVDEGISVAASAGEIAGEAGVEAAEVVADDVSLNSFYSAISEDAQSFFTVSSSDGMVTIDTQGLSAAYSAAGEASTNIAAEASEEIAAEATEELASDATEDIASETAEDLIEDEGPTCCGSLKAFTTFEKVVAWISTAVGIANLIAEGLTVYFIIRGQQITLESIALERKAQNVTKNLTDIHYKNYQRAVSELETNEHFAKDIGELAIGAATHHNREIFDDSALEKLVKVFQKKDNANIIKDFLKGHLLHFNSSDPEANHEELQKLEEQFLKDIQPKRIQKRFAMQKQKFDSHNDLTKKVYLRVFNEWANSFVLSEEDLKKPNAKQLKELHLKARKYFLANLMQNARVKAMEELYFHQEYAKELKKHKKMWQPDLKF